MRIIASLRRNSRSRLIDISKETDVPISTVYNRILHLQGRLIEKFTCLLDYGSLGLVLATIMIKARKGSRLELQKNLVKQDPVNSLFKINNGYDFMVDAVFSSLMELEEFRETIEHQYRCRTKVHYIIERIKQESYLPRT